MKSFLKLAVAFLLGMALGWGLARQWPSSPSPMGSGRKIAFYQDSMHPWIKPDQPGKCTICGMDLSPVYEGDAGFALGGNLVGIPSNSLNVIHVQTQLVQPRPLHRILDVAGTIEQNEMRRRIIAAYTDGRRTSWRLISWGRRWLRGNGWRPFIVPPC